MTKNKKLLSIITLIIAIFICVGVVFALNSKQVLSTFGIASAAPVFTFDEVKGDGWWASENYNSQASANPEEYKGDEPIDKLPVAGRTVLKGAKGEYTTSCFVMFAYYDYKTDVAQLQKEKDDEVAKSTSMKRIGSQELQFSVLGAPKSLTMTNYELIGKEAKDSMKGMSYGWLATDDGHISVSGVCPTAAELKSTAAAINALSLTRS